MFSAILVALAVFCGHAKVVLGQPAPACGSTVPVDCADTLSGEITAASVSTSDCFTFSADPGEVVSISTARKGGIHIDPAWEMVDSLGTVIDFSCRVGVRACRATVALSGTPPYTVKVYDFGLDDPGKYTVTLEPLSSTFDGAVSCATPLACGTPDSALLEQASDVDSYSIAALAGEVLVVGVSRQTPGLSDPAWTLHDAAGAVVDASCAVDGASCQSTVTLSGPPPYTLSIADFELDEPSGGYSVSIQAAGASFGGAASCATALTCGDAVGGTFTHTASIKAYSFAAMPGEAVVIAAARESGGDLNPAWRLHDASGAPVDDSCNVTGAGCRARVVLGGAAPYTIVVTDEDLRTAGSFSLSLQPASATFASAPSCATTLACDMPRSGTISVHADTESYRIDADPGEAVFVTAVRESGGLLTPDWTVYDAAGTAVGSSCTSTSASCRRGVTLSGLGPYTLVVGDDSLATVGGYGISLQAASSTLDGGATCAGPIACGSSIGSTLVGRADSDSYTFDTAPSDLLSIAVTRTSGNGLLPGWRLFNDAGDELGSCELLSATCAGTAALIGSGPYTLAVYRTELGESGGYSLDVSSASCCASAAECAVKPCVQSTCNASSFCPVDDGASCDDGVACTNSDTCSGGTCLGMDACPSGRTCDTGSGTCAECFVDADCDDPNPCTADSCGATGDCSNVPASGPCDDGVFCNGADTCGGGSCSVHAGDPCALLGDCSDTCNEASATCIEPTDTPCEDDGTACTADICNGAGVCTHPPVAGPCDDGQACTTGDVCVNGRCEGAVPPACVDSDPCTLDSCNNIDGCVNDAAVSASCKVAGVIQFKVRDRDNDFGDRLKWKWSRGEATIDMELGDPSSSTTYALCVFDTVGGGAVRATTLQVPPDSIHWEDQDKKGWIYKDRLTQSDGVQRLRLRTGSAGKAKVELVAKGPSMPTPVPFSTEALFSQDPKVVVQLISSDGKCWTSTFDAPARVRQRDRFGDTRR